MYLAVCEDHTEELNLLTDLLGAWQSERKTMLRIQTFYNASELLDSARREQFTLYLLDVMLPGMNGIAAAQEIRSFDRVADIVFLTSSPSFAYESYGVGALDYLLKPISKELLFPLLDRLSLREQKPQEGLILKCGGTLVRILFSQLTHVEVNGKHLYFNMTDGSVREIAGALKDYEDLLLSRPEFMRIHRSYIVNMLQVAEFSTSGAITFSGKNLPVSRLLYPQLQQKYMKLLFSHTEV